MGATRPAPDRKLVGARLCRSADQPQQRQMLRFIRIYETGCLSIGTLFVLFDLSNTPPSCARLKLKMASVVFFLILPMLIERKQRAKSEGIHVLNMDNNVRGHGAFGRIFWSAVPMVYRVRDATERT
jgi:hypothetical protein